MLGKTGGMMLQVTSMQETKLVEILQPRHIHKVRPQPTLVLCGMMLQDTSSSGSVVHSSRNSSTGAEGLPICD